MFCTVKGQTQYRFYKNFCRDNENNCVSKSPEDKNMVESNNYFSQTEDNAILTKITVDVCKGSFEDLALGAYLKFDEWGENDEIIFEDGKPSYFPLRKSLADVSYPAALIYCDSIKKGILILFESSGKFDYYVECAKDENQRAQVGCVSVKKGTTGLAERVETNMRTYIIDALSIEDVKKLYEAKKSVLVSIKDDIFDVSSSNSRIMIGQLGG